MIENFKLIITDTKKQTINQYIKWFDDNYISFSTLLQYMESFLHIGVFYHIANIIGSSYENIQNMAYRGYTPAPSLKLRIINLIRNIPLQNEINVDFDVKPNHKNLLSYLQLRPQAVSYTINWSSLGNYTISSITSEYTYTNR